MSENTTSASIPFISPENVAGLEGIVDILFSDQIACEMALDLCIDGKFNHLIQRSNLCSQSDFNSYQNSKLNDSNFMKFPISTIMGETAQTAETENSLRVFNQGATEVYQKFDLLNSFEKCLINLRVNPSILGDAMNVMDELFTNAAISAPKIAAGFILNEKEYGTHKSSEAIKPLEIFAGADSQRIVIGCKDYYGVLDKELFLGSIRRCFTDDLSDVIRFNFGGAGIGAFLMYKSCASLYLGVSKNQETVVCFSLARKMSRLERDKMPKNIHVFL